MNLSRDEFPGLPGALHCSIRGGWVFLAALLWTLGAACAGGGEEAPAESAGQGGPALPVDEADWARGLEPALVERVEYLVAQLAEYRENLPPLDAFGYRPAWRGIWTGLVIVCGHVVPPPYEIEADLENDLVRLNGIELKESSFFNVRGQCIEKVATIHGARARARFQAWEKEMKEMDARPGVAEKCAKKKEIQEHGLNYFERRIGDLGISVDDESGQPDNWDRVFRACRDTQAELERVFGADIEKVDVPESKGGIMAFSLKDPISQSNCNGGAVFDLGKRFRDKQRYRKMQLQKEQQKWWEEHQAQAGQRTDQLVASWSNRFEEALEKGNILQFGTKDPGRYDMQAEVTAISSSLALPAVPKRIFATLLGAGIGRVNTEFFKNKAFRDQTADEALLMLVLAAQEHSRKCR